MPLACCHKQTPANPSVISWSPGDHSSFHRANAGPSKSHFLALLRVHCTVSATCDSCAFGLFAWSVDIVVLDGDPTMPVTTAAAAKEESTTLLTMKGTKSSPTSDHFLTTATKMNSNWWERAKPCCCQCGSSRESCLGDVFFLVDGIHCVKHGKIMIFEMSQFPSTVRWVMHLHPSLKMAQLPQQDEWCATFGSQRGKNVPWPHL